MSTPTLLASIAPLALILPEAVIWPAPVVVDPLAHTFPAICNLAAGASVPAPTPLEFSVSDVLPLL